MHVENTPADTNNLILVSAVHSKAYFLNRLVSALAVRVTPRVEISICVCCKQHQRLVLNQ